MSSSRPVRFAVIGLNHNHIYGQVDSVLGAGAELVGFHAPEDDLAAQFSAAYPQAPRVDDRRQLLDDQTIDLIVSAAIPDERAPLGIEVMRAGKDYMVDKPGMVSLDQLAEVRRVQQETGRIYSICYSEHFFSRATVRAGELIQSGAIGSVLHTVGLGPHRLNKPTRPPWFFQRERFGGILVDIASHQCEQFLFFTGTEEGEAAYARVGNRANPETPELQDIGEMSLRTPNATGYVRVDWFTPDGLPVWGDGRLVLLGTRGTIEIRKMIDLDGRPGGDHLLLVDQAGVQRIDCSQTDLPYGRDLLNDIRHRGQRAMSQARCFNAMELALKAQALAERG